MPPMSNSSSPGCACLPCPADLRKPQPKVGSDRWLHTLRQGCRLAQTASCGLPLPSTGTCAARVQQGSSTLQRRASSVGQLALRAASCRLSTNAAAGAVCAASSLALRRGLEFGVWGKGTPTPTLPSATAQSYGDPKRTTRLVPSIPWLRDLGLEEVSRRSCKFRQRISSWGGHRRNLAATGPMDSTWLASCDDLYQFLK
jgi:hypothetical protein